MRTRTRMDLKMASKRVTLVLLAATMFLLVDSVAASRSRFLQITPANVIQADAESRTHFITAAAEIGGSESRGSFKQRTLLQSLPTRPVSSGGDPPKNDRRAPPPPPDAS